MPEKQVQYYHHSRAGRVKPEGRIEIIGKESHCAQEEDRANDHHRRTRETVELPDGIETRNRPELEAEEVMAAIRKLPEAYREPLVLRLVEGMTGEEIAARTGLKPASVRVNLHRGMKQLRALMAKGGLR